MRRDVLATGTLLAGVAAAIYIWLLMGSSPFEPSASASQDRIEGLFSLVFWTASGVFVLVEGWLIYTVLRWGPEGQGQHSSEHDRGHHRLEIAWTIPPVVVFLTIAVLSAETLDTIERPPTDAAFRRAWDNSDPTKSSCTPLNDAARSGAALCVIVIASQWQWTFVYPDQSRSGTLGEPDAAFDGANVEAELWIPEDTVVVLQVRATDVIHSFWVREFGIKVDAIPGSWNTYWLNASKPGTYLLQCAEYCGGAHSRMRGEIHVFEKTADRRWGPPPAELKVTELALTEAAGQLALQPATVEADQGQALNLKVTNQGTRAGNLAIGAPYDLDTREIAPGASVTLSFIPFASGSFDVLSGAQTVGQLVVREARIVEIVLEDVPALNIVPEEVRYAPGAPYIFHITSKPENKLPHNFFIGDWITFTNQQVFAKREATLRPGEEAWLNVTLPDLGEKEYWCNVPGHYDGNPAATMGGRLLKGTVSGFSATTPTPLPPLGLGAVASSILGAVGGALAIPRRR